MWYVIIAMKVGTSAGIVLNVSKVVEVVEMVVEVEVVMVIKDMVGATLGRIHGRGLHQ